MNKCTAPLSKSKECTKSHQCDKSSTTQSDEKKISNNKESTKNEAYEHMKSNLFTFLKTKIPLGKDDLDVIQYDPFVEQYKQSFMTIYCNEFKIKDRKIVRKWYTDIISDKGNWSIFLEAIEAQITLSEGVYILN